MAKILVVDDDPEILFILRTTFESVGHEVIQTSKPNEVFQLIERCRPDAMTLDVMMPEISGWEVLEKLRGDAETIDLPILMLTAMDEVPARVRGLRQGADDYVVKPFSPDELVARMERLIVRARHNRPKVVAPRKAPALVRQLAEIETRLGRKESIEGLPLARYTVCEELGVGAMGRVFRAWDDKLKRHVALKTIRCDNTTTRTSDQVHRLVAEAEACAACNHPNIVTIFDVYDEGPAGYISMEVVDGGTLKDQLEGGRRLTPELAVPLAAGISAGLAQAHERGLLHRDIKPANVLLGTDHSIKLTDFGISARAAESSISPRAYGTPGYIAPETLSGDGCNAASDLFALGVVLYETFTGRHPFVLEAGRNKPAHVVHNTLIVRQIPACELHEEIPPTVSDMIDRLLEKDPRKRPQSCDVVAHFFERFAQRRKTTWTWQPLFAPPPPLDSSMLDSALDPALEAATLETPELQLSVPELRLSA